MTFMLHSISVFNKVLRRVPQHLVLVLGIISDTAGAGNSGRRTLERKFIALVKLMYPLAGITGRFDGSFWNTTKNGIQLKAASPFKKVKHGLPVKPDKLPCKAFQLADQLYQGMTQETKDIWRKATKKSGMSTYDLFMKECLTCFNSNRNAPATPSISGGYSVGKVLCDSLVPPPT